MINAIFLLLAQSRSTVRSLLSFLLAPSFVAPECNMRHLRNVTQQKSLSVRMRFALDDATHECIQSLARVILCVWEYFGVYLCVWVLFLLCCRRNIRRRTRQAPLRHSARMPLYIHACVHIMPASSKSMYGQNNTSSFARHYAHKFVCARLRACVRMCTCVCVFACACSCVSLCVRACLHIRNTCSKPHCVCIGQYEHV